MRGKALVPVQTSLVLGITPAYAGKSVIMQYDHRGRVDHPRLCGEKYLLLWRKLHRSGSPPPMRGKESRTSGRLRTLGITPAYAGKSDKHRHLRLKSQDHPRLCGEKILLPHIQHRRTGSPPPMRGKAAFLSAFCAA